MPLYMDVHSINGGVSPADVAKAHMADLQTQGKYDVRYLRYWVNQHNGKVFCLVEAPSPDAAATVHREAHKLGMRTTATMMFGCGETLDHRVKHDPFAADHLFLRLAVAAIDLHPPFSDPLGKARAGVVGQQGRQRLVEALARQFQRYLQFKSLGIGHGRTALLLLAPSGSRVLYCGTPGHSTRSELRKR